jgi:hypothetical protein
MLDKTTYTILELADRWSCHHETIRRQIRKYKETGGRDGIKAFKFAGVYRIHIDTIREIEDREKE